MTLHISSQYKYQPRSEKPSVRWGQFWGKDVQPTGKRFNTILSCFNFSPVQLVVVSLAWVSHAVPAPGGYGPKCRTVYETAYNTVYEQQCSTSYEQACSTSYQQECSTSHEKQCSTSYETSYKTSFETQCSTSYEKQCSTAYETSHAQQCSTTYQQVCSGSSHHGYHKRSPGYGQQKKCSSVPKK